MFKVTTLIKTIANTPKYKVCFLCVISEVVTGTGVYYCDPSQGCWLFFIIVEIVI